jgi:hypothetical protein
MNTQNSIEKITIEKFETLTNRISFLRNKIKEYSMTIDLDLDEGWEHKYLYKYERELDELNGGIL